MRYENWTQRPPPIVCPVCKAPAVRERSVAAFSMPWTPSFDDAGRRHTHNPNGDGILYYCQNGHDFETSPCWCGWSRYDVTEGVNHGQSDVPEP